MDVPEAHSPQSIPAVSVNQRQALPLYLHGLTTSASTFTVTSILVLMPESERNEFDQPHVVRTR